MADLGGTAVPDVGRQSSATARLAHAASSHELSRGRSVLCVIGLALLCLPQNGASELGSLLVIAALTGLPRSTDRGVSLLILLFVVWCFFSTLWSVVPSSTVKSNIELGLLATAATLCVQRLQIATLRELTVRGVAVLAALNLSYAVVAPGTAFMWDGTLQGLFWHANALAVPIGVGIIAAVASLVEATTSRARWTHLGFVLLFGVTIGLTQSLTTMLAAGIGILVMLVVLNARKSGPYAGWLAAVAAGASIMAISVIVLNPQAFAALVGRDMTLTGRTDIWRAVVGFIQERLLLGYGYRAPFRPGSFLLDRGNQETEFTFYHAHNALLEVTLGTGIVGGLLIFALMALALAAWGGAALRHPITVAPIGLLIFFCIHGLSEATLNSTVVIFLGIALWSGVSTPIGREAQTRDPAV